jgi:hypothetical protein
VQTEDRPHQCTVPRNAVNEPRRHEGHGVVNYLQASVVRDRDLKTYV